VLGERRRRDICELVEKSGYVESRQLALSLGVNISTVRRDLEALAEAGFIQRTHGGAMPVTDGNPVDVPYEVKKRQRLVEKRAIANYAAALVREGDSLVLDSGSTTYALAQVIRGRGGLTIATNDLRIAHYLAEGGGVRLLVTGGQLIDSVFTLVGPSALTNLAGLQVDWAFLGADAVDSGAGVTNVNTVEVPIKQAMLAAAARKVLLADSSKFGRRALAAVVGLDAFDYVITDTGLSPERARAYGERLIRVPTDTRERSSTVRSAALERSYAVDDDSRAQSELSAPPAHPSLAAR
jgi:DeoR/GlpR family transcriptional regulator of sugar metabolism